MILYNKKSVFSFIWSFVIKYKFALLVLLTTSTIAAFDEAITPFMLNIVLKNIEKLNANLISYSAVQISIFYMIGVWIFFDILYRISGLLSSYIYPKIEAKVRMMIFQEIQFYRPSYFADEAMEGVVENSVSDTADGVQEILEFLITTLIPTTAAILACVCQIFWRNQTLGILITSWALLHLIFSILLLSKSVKCSADLQNAQNQLASKIIDSLINRNLTLQFNKQEEDYKHIQKYQDHEIKSHKNLLFLSEMIKFILNFFVIIVCIFLFLHILTLLKKQILNISDLVFLYLTIFNIVRQVWQIGTQLGPFVEALGQCSKGLLILNDKMRLLNLDNKNIFHPQDNSVEFRNVTLYENNICILNNVSFFIASDMKIAILGNSGSGKTTILKLILGLTSDYTGEILIGKQNIKNINSEAVRDYCGFLDQKHYWFDKSVRENLIYGKQNATDSELEEVCKQVAIYEYIQALPQKWDTVIGISKLSGGQLQRLCVARALLRNAPIIMFDEFNNGLDMKLQKILGNLIQQYNGTCILTTHNLYCKTIFHQFIIIENGKFIDQGNENELMIRSKLFQNMLAPF
jgi:ATP-binding cassette, subfamily B, bacterial